jgi:hypothetical protein
LSKSRPLRFAWTNLGPTVGTIYSAAKNANREKPNEVYSPGRGGTGSRRGLTTNHDATGTKETSSTVESGLGERTI